MFFIFPILFTYIKIIIKSLNLKIDSNLVTYKHRNVFLLIVTLSTAAIIGSIVVFNYILLNNNLKDGLDVFFSILFAIFSYIFADYCNFKIFTIIFKDWLSNN